MNMIHELPFNIDSLHDKSVGSEKLDISSASFMDSSTRISSSNILLTIPIYLRLNTYNVSYLPSLYASILLMCLPVRVNSIALDFPTARISLCVPPPPGMVPSFISGNPNFAFLPAYIISHIKANSNPPPN
jgi:hypothetical protein